MPNQPYRAISDLGRQVDSYLETYVKDAEADFPLDYATIQRMVVKPETLALIKTLINDHKYTDIDTYNEVYFGLPDHPDIKRSPQLQAQASGTQRFYLAGGMRQSMGDGRQHWYTERKSARLTGSLDVLDEGQIIKLISWVEKAITARRAANLIVQVVGDYLRRCSPSLWHVMVQMPTLKLAFNQQTRAWSNDSPRRPHHYAWHSDIDYSSWLGINEKYFNLIQRVMLETSLLRDVKNPRVRVHNWVRLGQEQI